MGSRGPKPAPTALKLVRGTKPSRINRREPIPPKGAIECPSWLSVDAKREWRKHAASLEEAGLLSVWDVDLFAQWCEAVVLARRARKELGQRKSLLIKGQRGGDVKHPALQIVKDAVETMMRLSVRFGFDPSSRSQLRPGGGSPDGKSKERFLT